MPTPKSHQPVVVYIILSVMGYLAWRKDWRGLAGRTASLPVE